MTARAAWLILAAIAEIGVDGQATPPASRSPDVVVEARTRQSVDQLVTDLTPAENSGQIARWTMPVCPSVIGIDDSHRNLIADRFAAIAKVDSLGMPRARCSPNVFIVFTADGDAFMKTFIAEHPGLFRQTYKYGIAHDADFAPLLKSRAVRWVRGSRVTSATGRPSTDDVFTEALGSRVSRGTRESTIIELLVVDENRLAHVTWGQLADYLAFVTYTKAPLDGIADSGTILSLFATRNEGQAIPAGLSAADHAVLRALYHSDASLDASQQRSQIRTRVRKDGIGSR